MPFKLNINDSRAHLFISLLSEHLATRSLVSLVALEEALGPYFHADVDSNGFRAVFHHLRTILNSKITENEYPSESKFEEEFINKITSKVPRLFSYKSMIFESLRQMIRFKNATKSQPRVNVVYNVFSELGRDNPRATFGKSKYYIYKEISADRERKLKRLSKERGILIDVANNPWANYISTGNENLEDLIDKEELKNFLATFKEYQNLLKEKDDPSEEVKDQIFLKAMTTLLGDNLSRDEPISPSVMKKYYRLVQHELKTQEKADSLFEDLESMFSIDEDVSQPVRVRFVSPDSVEAFDRIKIPEAWGLKTDDISLKDGREAVIVYQDVREQLNLMKECVKATRSLQS